MITRKFSLTSLFVLVTFTSLGALTSTAFSQNVSKLLTGQVQNFAVAAEPRDMKDFSFVDGAGKTHKLSDFKGKTVLLNFWATWCAPCRKEMPGLDRLQGEMGSDDFVVLAIGQDLQGIEKVKKFFESLKLENLAIYNDKTVKSGRAAGVFGLPATLLINRAGLEFGRLVGPAEWDSEEAKTLIKFVVSSY